MAGETKMLKPIDNLIYKKDKCELLGRSESERRGGPESE